MTVSLVRLVSVIDSPVFCREKSSPDTAGVIDVMVEW